MKSIEIELTSACNARCGSCQRTMMANDGRPVEIRSYTIEEFEQYFDSVDMRGWRIKLCGVLGDPIACKDLYEITEYLLDKEVRFIEVSTNAGLKTKKFWERYGSLSKESDGRLNIHFAIDGVHTNDYRVGVDLKKVWNNVDSYLRHGGYGSWQFIIFDYNKHEVEEARILSKEKGMQFITRTAWKNDSSEKEQQSIYVQSLTQDYD
jgi:molybdenum cofactor biosynthesis enzyme MoaA